jgi:biotin transport system substrate-specific component
MKSKTQRSLKILATLITIALASQMTIDIGEIPITGQTLSILCWAFFLTPGEALIALISYLILGTLGLPIFADGGHGLEKLSGGSGGYLLGFVIAASLVSYLYSRIKSNTFLYILGLTILGTLVILLFGVGRLITMYGLEKGIEYGLVPFWKGALVKILAGSIVVWTIKQIRFNGLQEEKK